MGVQEDFEKAAEEASNVIPSNITNDEKLALYGLFKQAKFGDNTAAKPGILDIQGRKKWFAWEEHKGKDSETAMKEYIAKVEELKAIYCT
ncbi:hypothetical protein BSKO_05655 [Bryopsis sp. KO-2023]|nr:hypothetical protein BSKO_05655 [Bryopsis sp. KO-2023]